MAIAANVLTLFNEGVFWDDWTFYHNSEAGTMAPFYGNGFWIWGHFHFYLNHFPKPVLLYRVLHLMSFAATFISFFWLLSQLKPFKNAAFSVALLAIWLPFNPVRHTMMVLTNSLCLAFFSVGLVLVYSSLLQQKVGLRWLGLLLILPSFTLNSLLPFYVIVVGLLVIYHEQLPLSKLLLFSTIWRLIAKYKDLVALPLVYALIKYQYFRPTGVYSQTQYNAISWKTILYLPVSMFSSLRESFLGLPREWLDTLASPIGVAVAAIAFFALRKVVFAAPKNNISESNRLITIGFLIFLLGLFPYALVNKIPSFQAYDGRHQILLAFGGSLFIVGAIEKMTTNLVLYRLIFSGIVALSLSTTLRFQLSSQRQAFEQTAIIEQLKTNRFVKDNHYFQVVHNTHETGGNKIDYLRFYEYSSFFQEAFQTQTRFGVEITDPTFEKYPLKLFLAAREEYKITQFVEKNQFDGLLIIHKNASFRKDWEVLRLLYLRYTNQTAFLAQLQTDVTLTAKPY